jgi:hypothetical protein
MECGVTRAGQIYSDVLMEIVTSTQELRHKLQAIIFFALDWKLGITMLLVRKSVFGWGQRLA